MRPIYESWAGHLIITNGCNLECSNCTQNVGHYAKPYMMTLEKVREAILSLVTPFKTVSQDFPKGYPGVIGIFGGEPTSHPKFAEICGIVQELIPDKSRRGLWTDGYRMERYKRLIIETFDPGQVHINTHEDETGRHQPLLLAAEEIMEDRELMWQLIGNCWIQQRWSFGITPKGGFFCERAAALDMLFDGPGGYPLVPGWWAKDANDFLDQVNEHCVKCSAAIPMPATLASTPYDIVSPGNLERLKKAGSPKVKMGNVRVFEGKLTRAEIEEIRRKGWYPYRHDDSQVYLNHVADFTTYRPPLFSEERLVQISGTK